MGLLRTTWRSINILDSEVFINEKAIVHLLLVLDSLFATNHSYNHDLVVTGASASSGRFSGAEFLLPALFKVPLRLQP